MPILNTPHAGGAALLLSMLASAVAPNQQQQPPPAAAPTQSRDALAVAGRRWTGDFNDMLKRRMIRVAVTYSKTHYFIERGMPRGAAYEGLKAFEDDINASRRSAPKVHVVFVPMSSADLLPALVDGRADLAVAGISITPSREKIVDFSMPTTTQGVREIAVTGPQSPQLAAIEELAGKEVFIRKSSSYWEHAEELNADFVKKGKPPIVLRAAPEDLSDEDVLEMVNAGLVAITVVDAYKANLWSKALTQIRPQPDIAVHTGGALAWAFRKNSPELKAAVDAFLKTHRQGTTFGNTLIRRYAANPTFVKNATSDQEIKKFQQTVEMFRTYGSKYDMDYLLMMAQGYQESRLDPKASSHVGAVGVMQLMPDTGKQMKVGDISQTDANIHAGVKYMRFMIDQYFATEPMDRLNKGLFAFASYNAGPARIRQLRREAKQRGLNPNVWFNNVEAVALDRIGPETVTYVSNIYKYYVAYTLVVEDMSRRQKAKETVAKKPPTE